jgi:hypothetical protein
MHLRLPNLILLNVKNWFSSGESRGLIGHFLLVALPKAKREVKVPKWGIVYWWEKRSSWRYLAN